MSFLQLGGGILPRFRLQLFGDLIAAVGSTATCPHGATIFWCHILVATIVCISATKKPEYALYCRLSNSCLLAEIQKIVATRMWYQKIVAPWGQVAVEPIAALQVTKQLLAKPW